MNNISDYQAHKRDEEFDAKEDRKVSRKKAPDAPVAKCQCEHDIHFFRLEVRGNVHSYGAFAEVAPIKTLFGTFTVCKDCAETCLAIYRAGVVIDLRRGPRGVPYDFEPCDSWAHLIGFLALGLCALVGAIDIIWTILQWAVSHL